MYLSDVLSGTAEIANLCGKRNTPQYISGLAGIEIECKVNTVLHHIHIHSSVVGTCCFPADIRVGVGGNCSSGDRKSTRLNSSHVASSYAVFCLKKNRKLTV